MCRRKENPIFVPPPSLSHPPPGQGFLSDPRNSPMKKQLENNAMGGILSSD